MKNDLKRICAVFCMEAVVCSIAGCSQEVDFEQSDIEKTETQLAIESSQVVEESEPSQEFVEESEATEENIPQEENIALEKNEIQDKIVDYGDNIIISCDITEQPIVWKDAGEAEFQVATISVQFQNEFDLFEETTTKKVEGRLEKQQENPLLYGWKAAMVSMAMNIRYRK